MEACLQPDIKLHNHSFLYLVRNPVRPKIFNFNKFVYNLDVQENNILSCNYVGFAFLHIATVDLRIIRLNCLRKLFTNGPEKKYHISWENAKAAKYEGFNSCVDT